MRSDNGSGISETSCGGVGSFVARAVRTAIVVSPLNGLWPVHSKYSTLPRLKRSVRAFRFLSP